MKNTKKTATAADLTIETWAQLTGTTPSAEEFAILQKFAAPLVQQKAKRQAKLTSKTERVNAALVALDEKQQRINEKIEQRRAALLAYRDRLEAKSAAVTVALQPA